MPFADDRVVHLHSSVDRHGETNALVAAAPARDHGIDTDYFAVDVQQRPAAVTGIDRRIGLNKVLKTATGVVAVRHIASERANDTRRDSRIETERRTDRHSPVPYLDGVGVSDLRGHQILFIDVDHREIGVGIGANHGGGIFGHIVVELHGDLGRFLDHVVVRQNVSVLIDHDAGTQSFARHILLRHHLHAAASAAPKEALEQLLHAVVALIVRIGLHLAASPRRG